MIDKTSAAMREKHQILPTLSKIEKIDKSPTCLEWVDTPSVLPNQSKLSIKFKVMILKTGKIFARYLFATPFIDPTT